MAKKKPGPAPELNPQRELFCRYLTQNSELFGQATLSYAEAISEVYHGTLAHTAYRSVGIASNFWEAGLGELRTNCPEL